jgi:hypothetical protein
MDGPPAWGLGMELKPLTIKNKLAMKHIDKPQACTDSLVE